MSYASTSFELSDRTKYDFLLRTVPPDYFQSRAMLDFIMIELNWTSVYVLYSEGSYGEHGFDSFYQSVKEKRNNSNNSIHIVDQVKLQGGSTVEKLIDIFKQWSVKEKDVRGIISYCELHDIKNIIQALNESKLANHYRLIGSDTWLLGERSEKAIIFTLAYNQSKLNGFYNNWYKVLHPRNVTNEQNPWFEEFWKSACFKVQLKHPQLKLNCNDTKNSTFMLCQNSSILRNLEETCPVDDKLPYIIDSVYAFAYAINKAYIVDYNSNKRSFSKFNLQSRAFIDEYLSKVNFSGLSGPVNFPKNDLEARGNYDIILHNQDKTLVNIGHWNAGVLNMNKVLWDPFLLNFNGSTCQKDCKINEKRLQKYSGCWDCKPCKKDEFLKNITTCKPCLKGQKPSKILNFTACDDLPIKHMDRVWKIFMGFFASAGVLATFFTVFVFVRHNETPLVKAQGRELTYILLSGVIMLFVIPFFLIMYPNNIACGIARFNVGFFLSVCYGALLVKTNRIARIFSGRKTLLFLTPSWQVLLTLFIVMPQLLIGIIELVSWDKQKFVTVKPFEDYQIIMCLSQTKYFIASLVYDVVLVILCTYYAFKTRKVPANFNEARIIGFVMYTSCVIWIAFIPVYFGTGDEYRTIFIMLNVIINAMTLLIGLFGMKMYIILLRPDKNSFINSKIRSVTFSSERSHSGITIDGKQFIFLAKV